jgi:hypothetical protein
VSFAPCGRRDGEGGDVAVPREVVRVRVCAGCVGVYLAWVRGGFEFA